MTMRSAYALQFLKGTLGNATNIRSSTVPFGAGGQVRAPRDTAPQLAAGPC